MTFKTPSKTVPKKSHRGRNNRADKWLVGYIDLAEVLPFGSRLNWKLQGWIAHKKSSISEIKVSVDGKTYHEIFLFPRSDVYNHFKDATVDLRSGFSTQFQSPKFKYSDAELAVYFTAKLKNGKTVHGKLLTPNLKSEARYEPPVSTANDGLKKSHAILARAETERYFKFNDTLGLQKSTNPDISIIIVTYGREELLFKCLQSIQQNTKSNVEVIIIDNNSPETCKNLLRKIEGARVVFNKKNIHFLRAANQGAKLAKGQHLLFLNSDCTLLPGAIETLFDSLQKDPRAGAAGPMVLQLSGRVYELGCKVHHSGDTEFLHLEADRNWLKLQENQYVDYVSGACLLTAKKTFEKMKGFNLSYAPAYYEDVDYCLRLARVGLRVLAVPSAEVIHVGNASSKNLAEINVHLQTNRQQLLQDHFQPDKARLKDREFGVNLSGLLSSEKGVGRSVRSSLDCLKRLDIPLAVNAIADPGSQNTVSYDSHYNQLKNPYAVNLIHLHPDGLDFLFRNYGASYLLNHYNIGYWVWEQEEVPESWLPYFSLFDEIWTPSEFTQKILSNAAKVPVYRIPHIVPPPNPVPTNLVKVAREKMRIDDRFVFLFAFDFASSLNRKNALGLIDAFELAFKPSSKVLLLIKTSRGQLYTDDYTKLLERAGRNPTIRVIDQVFSADEMTVLNQCANSYISLHRSEGFGLTIAEAMAQGLPTIATGYSGNLDFMNDDNSLLVPGKRAVMGSGVDSIYLKNGTWFEPDIEIAAKFMRRVCSDSSLRKKLSVNGAKTIQAELGERKISTLIGRRLAVIKKQLHL